MKYINETGSERKQTHYVPMRDSRLNSSRLRPKKPRAKRFGVALILSPNEPGHYSVERSFGLRGLPRKIDEANSHFTITLSCHPCKVKFYDLLRYERCIILLPHSTEKNIPLFTLAAAGPFLLASGAYYVEDTPPSLGCCLNNGPQQTTEKRNSRRHFIMISSLAFTLVSLYDPDGYNGVRFISSMYVLYKFHCVR